MAARQAVARSGIFLRSPRPSCTQFKFLPLTPITPHIRFKSKKSKSDKDQPPSTATLIPRSQQILPEGDALREYLAAEEKMKTAVDRYRKECATLEMRASGRVTPSILTPVRVHLPEHGKNDSVRLEDVATVAVRDGIILWIVAFQEQVDLSPVSELHIS
jgi:ribosome recycling factor